VDTLENEKKELVSLRNKYEYEYKNMRAKIEAYEMEKSRDTERIQLLEDRLRELEFGNGNCYFALICTTFYPSPLFSKEIVRWLVFNCCCFLIR
jgi:hypothetical protein